MAHTDGRDIGRLLDTLVPELPAVPDRLAAIERRARRQRARVAALTAACAVLILLGTSALLLTGRTEGRHPPAGRPRPGAGSCPSQPPTFPRIDGALPRSGAGELAPTGAVRAIRCQYESASMRRWPVGIPGPARELVLTRDVAGLVTALNELPAEEPLDPCFYFPPYPTGGYLTLAYEDGATVTLEFGKCGVVHRGDITRHDGFLAVQAFDERYRQQEIAAAVPEAVTPGDCAARLAPAQAHGRFTPDPVSDLWLHTYDGSRRGKYLPAPAVVITACRYERQRETGYERTKQVSDRALASPVAEAVETAYLTTEGEIPFLDCGPSTTIRTVDTLILRDSVGETTEVRIPRDNCDVITFGVEGATPNPALLALLNQLLGPPD